MGDPLADVVAELYALPPEEFTAARNERAKQAKADGDKPLSQEIGKLRKPSAAAWVLNQMVRHHRGEIDQFLAIGEALREAQAEFDADQLKELSRQRHQVVAAVARQARALSRQLGNPVSNAVEAEVEQTLRAALADPAAADAVSSGQLTKTLDYVGLGDTRVDLTGAVAVPGTTVATPAALRAVPATPAPDAAPDQTDDDRAARRRAELEQARQDAEDGERAAAEADEDLATAERRVGTAEDRRGELEAQVADLERQVEEARDELAVAGRDVRSAGRERDRAAKHADAAHVAADRARARVARLEERG